MGKKVTVIGAGVSGLAAAVRLQHQGYDVEIFEKQSSIGGRMGITEMDGFRFDLGPTILMTPQIYRQVFSDCGVNPDDYLDMQRLDPIYKVYFSDGTCHEVSSELSKLVPELEKMSLSETQGYLKYLEDTYKRYMIARNSFIERTFRKASDFYNPATLADAIRLRSFNNAYASISQFVKDKKLRELLSFQTLYVGMSPFNGPSIYTIIPMIELIYGVWFLKGGMYAMAEAMGRLFRERGGVIHLDSPVESIHFEGRKADGVIISQKHIKADHVLCSADFPYAMKELLPGNFRQAKYKPAKVDQLGYSCSCDLFYIGLDKKDFPGLNVHSLVISADFDGNISDIFAGRFPDDPSIHVYAPALLDESLAPDGQLGLYVLTPVPNLKEGVIDWHDKSFRDMSRRVVFERIRRIHGLEDFEQHIVCEKRYMPGDLKSDFNALYGAAFGLKPTLKQSNYWRPQPKATRYEQLYFTGSSVHPGAGVPIVLTSAKLAVSEILKDDKGEAGS